jgi:putative phosphoribosyl transferase
MNLAGKAGVPRLASRPFRNRSHAGKLLGQRLRAYADRSDVLVLALPRGGVPVAYEVAAELHAALDVLLVRKLGVPGYEELAMGAIASGGLRVVNEDVVRSLNITADAIEQVAARELVELNRRDQLYRDDRPEPDPAGRIVILVDDGLATGSTMRAAAQALASKRPARLVVAVPVAAPEICEALAREVDEVICALTPEPFHAVGLWYDDFDQTSDEDVRALLSQNRRDRPAR